MADVARREAARVCRVRAPEFMIALRQDLEKRTREPRPAGPAEAAAEAGPAVPAAAPSSASARRVVTGKTRRGAPAPPAAADPDATVVENFDVCKRCGVPKFLINNDSMMACPRCHEVTAFRDPALLSTSTLIPTRGPGVGGADGGGGAAGGAAPGNGAVGAQGTTTGGLATQLKNQEHRFIDWVGLSQGKRPRAAGRGRTNPDDPELLRAVGEALLDLPEAPRDLTAAQEDLSWIDAALVSRALDRLGKSGKIKDHAVRIASHLRGWYPPQLTADQENELIEMFRRAAPVYDRFRNPDVPGFPGGYRLFAHAACRLRGWDHLAELFPLPPRKSLEDHERIRERVWAELDWEFRSLVE